MKEASPLPQLCLALQLPTQTDSIPLGLHPAGNSPLPPPEATTNRSMFQRCSALASAAEGGMEIVYCGLRTVSLSSCFLWASKLSG